MAGPESIKVPPRPKFESGDITSFDDLRDFGVHYANAIKSGSIHGATFQPFTDKLTEVARGRKSPTKAELKAMQKLWETASKELHEKALEVDGSDRSTAVLRRYHSKLKAHMGRLRGIADVNHRELYNKDGGKRSDQYAKLYGRLNVLGNRIGKLEDGAEVDEAEFQKVKDELTTLLNQVRDHLDPDGKRKEGGENNGVESAYDWLSPEELDLLLDQYHDKLKSEDASLDDKLNAGVKHARAQLENLRALFAEFDTKSEIGKRQSEMAVALFIRKREALINESGKEGGIDLVELQKLVDDTDAFYNETLEAVRKHADSTDPDTGDVPQEFISELSDQLGLPSVDEIKAAMATEAEQAEKSKLRKEGKDIKDKLAATNNNEGSHKLGSEELLKAKLEKFDIPEELTMDDIATNEAIAALGGNWRKIRSEFKHSGGEYRDLTNVFSPFARKLGGLRKKHDAGEKIDAEDLKELNELHEKIKEAVKVKLNAVPGEKVTPEKEVDAETQNAADKQVKKELEHATAWVENNVPKEEQQGMLDRIQKAWQVYIMAANAAGVEAGTLDKADAEEAEEGTKKALEATASRKQVLEAYTTWNETVDAIMREASPEFNAWYEARQRFREARRALYEAMSEEQEKQRGIVGLFRSKDTARIDQLSKEFDKREQQYLRAADSYNAVRIEDLRASMTADGKSPEEIDKHIGRLTGRLESKQVGRGVFEGKVEAALGNSLRIDERSNEEVDEWTKKFINDSANEMTKAPERRTALERVGALRERFHGLPKWKRRAIGVVVIAGIPVAVGTGAVALAGAGAGAATLAGLTAGGFATGRFAAVSGISALAGGFSFSRSVGEWVKRRGQKGVEKTKQGADSAAKDDFEKAREALRNGESKEKTVAAMRKLIRERNHAYLEALRKQQRNATAASVGTGAAAGVAIGGTSYWGLSMLTPGDVPVRPGPNVVDSAPEVETSGPDNPEDDGVTITAEEQVTRSDAPENSPTFDVEDDAAAAAEEIVDEAAADVAAETVAEPRVVFGEPRPYEGGVGLELPEGFEAFTPNSYTVGPTGPWVSYAAIEAYPDLFPPENDRAWLPFLEYANSPETNEYLRAAGVESGNMNTVFNGNEIRLDMIAKLKLWFDAGMEGVPPIEGAATVTPEASVATAATEGAELDIPPVREGVPRLDISTNPDSATPTVEIGTTEETAMATPVPEAVTENGSEAAVLSRDEVIASAAGAAVGVAQTPRVEAVLPAAGTESAEVSRGAATSPEVADEPAAGEESEPEVIIDIPGSAAEGDVEVMAAADMSAVYESSPYRGAATMAESMREDHLAELSEIVSEEGISDPAEQAEILAGIIERDALVLNSLVDTNYTSSLGTNAIFNLTELLGMTVSEAVTSGDIEPELAASLDGGATVREAFADILENGTVPVSEREVAGRIIKTITPNND